MAREPNMPVASDDRFKQLRERLLEDRKHADVVHKRLSTQLRALLEEMRAALSEVRSARPNLDADLKHGGVMYDHLHALPFDRLCEVRVALLERCTDAYGDLDGLAAADREPDEIVRTVLLSVRDDLRGVILLLAEGMAVVREARVELGGELLPGGLLHDKLYGAPLARIATIRDGLPILVNAVFSRQVLNTSL